jgi:hypothetical protein
MASDTPAPAQPPQGEPLPAGAPTQDYPLTAWCYGAMSEYLAIYQRVKPDLRAIDKMWGSSEPNETEPYADDMAAARDELKVLAGAVEAAEKASPTPIAPQGVDAIRLGRSIWSPAEAKTSRELARAWLSWALPDRCDSTARDLAAKSALLGQALRYNTGETAAPDASAPPQGQTAPTPDAASQPTSPASPPVTAPPVPVETTPLPPAQTAPAAPIGGAPPTEAPQPAPVRAPASPPATPSPASAPTVDSLLSGAPPSASPQPVGAATTAPSAAPADMPAGAQPAPEIAPAPSPTVLPAAQPDPNGPIPDPAPQAGAPQA